MEAPRSYYGSSYDAPRSTPPPLPPSALADEIGWEAAPAWPLADPLRRVCASLLDGLFALVAFLPGLLLIVYGIASETYEVTGSGVLVLALAVLVFAVYQCWLLTTQGQTVAKQMLGLRIVRASDGGNPGFVSAVLLRGFVTRILSSFGGGLFLVADVVFMFAREDRRAIHDLIASTQVIDERGGPY